MGKTQLPSEEEFRERLQALGKDARWAARFAYTGTTINFVAAGRPELIARIDSHAGFWDVVLGALQSAAVVSPGRIYDRLRGVRSATKLLDHVIRYPGIFSRPAL